MLGVVFFSMLSASPASAIYFIEATGYCHATGATDTTAAADGILSCPVGSPITITPYRADGAGTGSETFDFDSDSIAGNGSPEVRNAKSATFSYNSPDFENVSITATDGSGSNRGYGFQITDADGMPDPSAGPAFRLEQSNVRAVRFDGSCLVIGRVGYESYRSSRALVKVVVQKRLRRPRSRAAKKWKRFTSLSRAQGFAPSYETIFHDVMKPLNPNGARLARLSRKHIFRIVVRQTVAVEGKMMYTGRLIKPFQPRACRIPSQPPQGSPAPR